MGDRKCRVPHHAKDKPEVRVQPTYQPSKAELDADMSIDATPEQLAVALQPMMVKTIEG